MRLPAALELVRPHNCLLAGLAVLVSVIIATGGSPPWLATAFAFAAAAVICAGGNAINDYCDRRIDAINRPERPIPSGRLGARQVLAMGRNLFIAGIILIIPLGMPCIVLAIVNSVVLALYAAELKRHGLIGNLIVGYLVGSTFLFGGLVVSEIERVGVLSLAVGELRAVGILAAMAALSTVGRELIKDIEDMRGDRKIGLKTFPLHHGARAAASLAIAFIAAALILSPMPYALGSFGAVYLAIVAVSVLAFIAASVAIARSQKSRSAGLASLLCKVAMGFGMLAFLAGAVS
ncbi:MAG: UbiA family prenyltransferase [Candidatus Hodarchaeaceae archaeon]|nr:UbiA family prenyltransferase [Candidatus Hodarchaeaceae archaeon]